MTAVILQPTDARIGVLTSEGVYHWPAIDSAGNAYMVPNDAIHWLDASFRRDGTRRFVIVAESMRGDSFGLVEEQPEIVPLVGDIVEFDDPQLNYEIASGWAIVEPEELAMHEPKSDEPKEVKGAHPKAKAKGKK